MSKKFSQADSIYTDLLANGDSSYLTLKYGGASKYYAGYYLPSIEPLEMAYEQDSTSVEVCLLLGSALGKTYDRKRALVLLDKAEQGLKPNPRLYYQAWNVKGTRVELAREISQMYNHPDITKFKSPEELQRGVFAQVFYLRELLKNGLSLANLDFTHLLLQSLRDDMSRRGVTEQALLAPDGQKSTLSLTELKSLISKLPEVSAGTKEMIEMISKGEKK